MNVNFVLTCTSPVANEKTFGLPSLPKLRICQTCGLFFYKWPDERRPVKTCSIQCRDERHAKRVSEMTATYRSRYISKIAVQGRPPSKRTMVAKPCVVCGKDFTRSISVSRIQPTCGRACGIVLLSRNNTAKHAGKLRTCAVCGTKFKPYRLNRFQKKSGLYQRTCGADCTQKYRETYGFRPTLKSENNLERSNALDHGQVRPVEIFARDEWTCRVCGCETPESLRGRTDSRSPEVDHLVPMSRGGSHTALNCRCVCRACNLTKSDAMPSPGEIVREVRLSVMLSA